MTFPLLNTMINIASSLSCSLISLTIYTPSPFCKLNYQGKEDNKFRLGPFSSFHSILPSSPLAALNTKIPTPLLAAFNLHIGISGKPKNTKNKIKLKEHKRAQPVTLIFLWKPKNTTGWRGVKARWTSVSIDICSVLFSGECKTQVCSVSKSQERIVQSCMENRSHSQMRRRQHIRSPWHPVSWVKVSMMDVEMYCILHQILDHFDTSLHNWDFSDCTRYN